MPTFIHNDTDTWYSAKWPYPSAKQIRDNATMKDSLDRSYCRVSDADQRIMELSRSKQWWWVALKNCNQEPLATRSRVRFNNHAPKIVIDVGLDFYPRRLVGIVSFSGKQKGRTPGVRFV